MGDRRAHSQENLSGSGSTGAHDSSPRGVNIYHQYTVTNVQGNVGSANFGNNSGTINGGSDAPQPAGGSQYSNTELDTLLAPISDASYTRNRKTSPPDSDCFPGTREGVIKGITDWADSPILFNANAPHVFWTHGYVGCGKSSISQAVSQKYGRKGRLLASFFFYRGTGDRDKMTKFAVTLASQMVAAVPATKSLVKAAVKADPALLKLTRGVSLATQLERLVYKPFNTAVKRGLILKTLLQGPFLVVIDGLDECEDKEEVKEFIEHLLAFFKRHPSTPLRFFITSRVEQHIKECLNADRVQLDDLVAHGSDEDILIFLETSFRHRVEKDPVLAAYVQSHGQWPTRNDMKTLVHHIGGSFIFASALFKYIVGSLDDGLNPMTRLPLTLNMNPGLDGLYAYTLARSQRLPHFSDVISTIALVFQPLSITAIAELLDLQTFEVLHILVNLQAVIHIPGTDELPVTFCHTSLRDFLTTENRSGRFFTPPSHHLYLSYRCSIVYNEQKPGNAAAPYSIDSCKEHFEQFARLPPRMQGPFPRFPQTLDAFYAHILATSQNIPYFSDILSTLALLHEPLPIEDFAKFVGLEVSKVTQVLDSLRAIIHVPSDTSPVTFRHASLRDFLTTESRSGRFFASPSYHLRLFYCCLVLGDEGRSGTAATAYSVGHHAKHFNCLPSSEQERLTTFPSPQSLDAFYTYILATAQHLPHFFDIISTIALLFEPLPIARTAELLFIETSEVVQVLVDLQAIIHYPGFDDLPVPISHTSLRNFLVTESRSGPFFISPSYHLKLSYRCFSLELERQLNNAPSSPFTEYSRKHWPDHWNKFQDAASEQSILAELKQLPRLPNQILSYHLFSFTQTFFWLFGNDSNHKPQQVSHALTRCIESLALALECDPAPDRWLQKSFFMLGFGNRFDKYVYCLKIDREQATALKRNIERIDTALTEKCPRLRPSRTSRDPPNSSFTSRWWLTNWDIIDTYSLFQWIVARVQTETNLVGSDTACDLTLDIALEGHRTTISLKASPSVTGTPRWR